MNDVRSFSQLSQYARCPYSYYLARVEKAWDKPAAWLPMGTGVHEAAEKWELSGRTMSLSEVQEVFKEAYVRDTNRLLGETPNTALWFGSGPYRGQTDITRRYKLGLEHVERYLAWYAEHPDQAPLGWFDEDGTQKLSVELPFKIEIGGVMVRGFIDWVGFKDGKVIVRDNKTGNKPGGPEQLATYALAVEDRWPAHHVEEGDFFMTRTGKPTKPYILTQAVKEQLAEDFAAMDENVKAEKFPPLPEASKCMFCSVRDSCSFKV